jgi:hypothetical protein
VSRESLAGPVSVLADVSLNNYEQKVHVERKKETKHKQTQLSSYFLSGRKNVMGT